MVLQILRLDDVSYWRSVQHDDNPENTKSVKERKQTAKGKRYEIQLFEDERSSAQRAWRSQLNKVEICLADSGESVVLQNERMFLEMKMELLITAHENLNFALEETCKTCRAREFRHMGT